MYFHQVKENYLTTARNELLETLKILEDCTSCKGKCNLDEFHESINKMENLLAELEKEKEQQKKEEIIYRLN